MKHPKSPRIDIATIRKEQIVDAAVSVIAEQGLQNLSLSEIEKRVGMSRGQLTYYFKAKEDILWAVFDRLLLLMREQHDRMVPREGRGFLEIFEKVAPIFMTKPAPFPAFHALKYTFLSQISHREDFRLRLADLFEQWRAMLIEDIERDGWNERSRFSPRTMASFIQAIFHGLAIQREADPAAFDGAEMAELCLDMLSTYIKANRGQPANGRAGKAKGQTAAGKAGRFVVHGVTHES